METEKMSDHPTSKGSHKCVDKEHTIRFALELKESNDRYFPEFSFRELLRSAVPKVGEASENDPPANDDGDREKLQALAKKFEEKYGPKQKHKKKRKERIEDLVDVTYGYDETDPFVDNSEAYDELIPADWTTEHGGFYINQGGLSFKPLSSDDSDDDDFKGKKRKTPKKLKDPNKVKKIKESGDKEKKRKHLTPTDKEKKPRKIRLISGDKEKKHKKKINLGGSSPAVTSSGPLLIKLISPNTTNSQLGSTKTTTVTSTTVSPSGSSVSLASSLMSLGANNLTPGLSVEGSPQSIENAYIKTEKQGPVTTENPAVDSPIVSSEPTSNVGSVSNSTSLINQNGLTSGEGAGEDGSFVPKLPQYLPLSVEACVQKLKKAADNAVDEGKCKFFNKDVNQLLLETETKSRELSCRVRSGIYDYLAYYLPCTKETLLKRAKKLLLTDQAGRLREPMAKLKAAVDKAMPEQIKKFEEEVRLHVEEHSKQNEAKPDSIDQSPEDKKKELFKSAMEVDDDGEKVDEATTPTDSVPQTGTEEKTKKASLPRRKFVWTDELRSLLSDVVTVRVKLFEMSKTRTTSAEEYLKEFFETEVKTLWPKGWMTSRILFKESKSVHTRVTSTLFKPKKVPGPKKQGEAPSPSDAMDTSSQNTETVARDDDKTTAVSMDTTPSLSTSAMSATAISAAKSSTVTPMTAAVKIEKIAGITSTSAPATMSSTSVKTLPKLDPSALSILKAKLIISNPGAANKTNIVLQPVNKVVSATILSTKPKTVITTALSTSAQASIVASAAKALAAMVNKEDKSSVSMVTTTKVQMSTVSNVYTTPAAGLTVTSKAPLSVGSVPSKPTVSTITTTPSTVMSTVSTSKPLTLNRMGVESRGAVTKGESTMEGRAEAKTGVTMVTNVTTNGLERQQQQSKFPLSMSNSLSKPSVTSVTTQRMMQPVSTAVTKQSPTSSTLVRNPTPPNNSTIKSQPVTILDFADMVSADSQNDAQEILSNQLQPQPQQPFISKSPSPQKPKEPSMPMIPKVPQVPQTVVSPPRQQNTAYSVTSPSNMIRSSPTQMAQTRTNVPHSSGTALGNMLMSCNMGSPNMANMQNKYIDLNAAAMMAQRQQAANNKTMLDSISAPSRMPLDMHTTSVPLTHPVISHQISNPTQSVSAYLPTNIQQPTLSMLGHANLQGKATNPLSHIGVVQQQSMPSQMMHMNRPLQQQSNMVMTPNPFNQVLIGYNVPSTQSMQMSQPQLMNPNIFQDPNHNPNGGHPPSSFMPRFS